MDSSEHAVFDVNTLAEVIEEQMLDQGFVLRDSSHGNPLYFSALWDLFETFFEENPELREKSSTHTTTSRDNSEDYESSFICSDNDTISYDKDSDE